MPQPLINGVQHAWSSIEVNLLGRTLTGIVSIEYGYDRAIEDHHGAGDEPVLRGYGNKVYKKTMLELFQFEVVALQQACGGDITSIPPFDIVVLYKSTVSAPQVVDVVQNCQFLNNIRSLKSGDTKSQVKLELITAGIKMQSV
jgi:hypothetical protein